MNFTISNDSYTRIHREKPTPENIRTLEKEYKLHELIAEDLYNINTETYVDIYDNTTIAISFNYPKFNTQKRRYMVNMVYLILKDNVIISISTLWSSSIRSLKHTAQRWWFDDSGDDTVFDVLYSILNIMYKKVEKWLKTVSKDIFRLQQELLDINTISPQDFYNLSQKKLNMISLKYMIDPQQDALQELFKSLKTCYSEQMHKKEEIELYMDDLSIKLQKTLNHNEMLYQTISALIETYDGMLNKKTNKQISLLTTFTIILWILTFISWLYGMNIPLPWQDQKIMFPLLISTMGIVVVITIFIFRKFLLKK